MRQKLQHLSENHFRKAHHLSKCGCVPLSPQSAPTCVARGRIALPELSVIPLFQKFSVPRLDAGPVKTLLAKRSPRCNSRRFIKVKEENGKSRNDRGRHSSAS